MSHAINIPTLRHIAIGTSVLQGWATTIILNDSKISISVSEPVPRDVATTLVNNSWNNPTPFLWEFDDKK